MHFISCIVVMQAVYFIVHYTHSITKNCSEMSLYCQSCTLLSLKYVVYLVWARLRLELIPIRIEVSFLQCDWTGGNEQNGCECICPASFSSSHLFLCFVVLLICIQTQTASLILGLNLSLNPLRPMTTWQELDFYSRLCGWKAQHRSFRACTVDHVILVGRQ